MSVSENFFIDTLTTYLIGTSRVVFVQPLTFNNCFAWLHRTVDADVGAILCGSSEYEAAATHQATRVLADRLAEAGIPALRFDYPGCGDSLGEPDPSHLIDANLQAIGLAADLLKEKLGVREVVLIGVRLGAALAFMAGRQRADVARLVMIRPILRGRAFVNEQLALARILAAQRRADKLDAGGDVEIEGFVLTRETIDQIATIDLSLPEYAPSGRILIGHETKSHRYDSFVARLSDLGAHVDKLELTQVGWGPSPIPPPAPHADIDAIVRWLGVPPGRRPIVSVAAGQLDCKDFVESGVAFGAAGTLRGVLCRPKTTTREASRRVVVFINTGANSHIGPGRSTVDFARGMARQGVATLRMDGLGIGDSDWFHAGPVDNINHIERVADLSAAADALEAFGLDDVAVVGVCSGAFIAFRAALKDARLRKVILFNPRFWLPPKPEELGPHLDVMAQGIKVLSSAYFARLNTSTGRVRFLNNFASPMRAASATWDFAGRLARTIFLQICSAAMRSVAPGKPRNKLESELRQLANQGCEIHLILSVDDIAREVFASLTQGSDENRLREIVRVDIVDDLDHTLGSRRGRGAVHRLMARALGIPARAERMDLELTRRN